MKDSNKISESAVIKENVTLGSNIVLEDNVYIDYGCIIRDNVHIKKGSFIGAGSILGEYIEDFYNDRKNKTHPLVIGENSIIRTGNVIYGDTVIGAGVETGCNVIIKNNCNISECAVINDNSVVNPGTFIGKNTVILNSTILGRKPMATTGIQRKVQEKLIPLKIGENCIIGAAAVLYTGSIFGNNVLVSDGASIREQCTVGDNTIIGRNVTVNYNTTIGKNVKIMDIAHITGNMKIGDDVFISMGVVSANDNTMGRKDYSSENDRGPVIGKFATIGGGACLLPGVNIGENSVIGMGAVVSKDVPCRKVAFGVPARVIKDVKPDLIKK